MKHWQKAIFGTSSLFLGLLPISSLSGCGSTSKSEVHIVSINDFHGAAPGFGDYDFPETNYQNAGAIRITNEAQKIISQYPGSCMLSCGDYNAGEAFSTVTHADTLYPILKTMNITYSAVGNHAWEWGKEPLESKYWDKIARTSDTQGNYFVTSNVLKDPQFRTKDTWCIDESDPQYQDDYNDWHNNQPEWTDPFKILDMNGHDVCIIGLTTKATLDDGNAIALKQYSFIDYNASVVYTKKLIKDTLGEQAFNSIEAFILLTHCECQPGANPSTIEGEAARLAKDCTTKIDGILAAHSHRECAGYVKNDKFGNNVAIAQASQSGRRYTDTRIVFDDSKPKGKRLDSISMNVKKPFIDYGKYDPTKPAELDKAREVAHKQLEAIKATNKIVQETIEEYKKQKVIALAKLQEPLGTLTKNVNYYFTEHPERSFGTQYMQSDSLIEPMGAWASKAQIWGFNNEFAEENLFPISTANFCLDSLKTGFLLEQSQESRQVLTREIFQLHSFENSTYYGCLTVPQLEQYINYFLEGAGRFSYSGIKKGYGFELDEVKITMNGDDDKTEMVYDNNETVWYPDPDTVVKGTSYVSGCNQFYGISFAVEKKGEPRIDGDKTYQPYQYKNGSLKIYDPTNQACSLDDPTTWIAGSNYDTNYGYIGIAVCSFMWQGGNAQNRMLHHWFDYNYEHCPQEIKEKVKQRNFSEITRNFALNYCKYLTQQGKNIDDGIDYSFMPKLIQMPEA